MSAPGIGILERVRLSAIPDFGIAKRFPLCGAFGI